MKKFLAKTKSMFWGDEPFHRSHSTLFIIYVSISILMVILSLILAQFSMPFFGAEVQGYPILIAASIITYPITYIVSDVMSECYGFSASIRTVWLTFVINLSFVLFLMIGAVLPVPGFESVQQGLINLMGFGFLNGSGDIGALGVIFASFLAFIVGRWTDSIVFAIFKKKAEKKDSKKLFIMRAVVSSIAGELIDCAIFMPLLYLFTGQYGVTIHTFWQVLCIILAFTALKLVYEIVVLPITMILTKKTNEYETKYKKVSKVKNK